MTDRSKEKGTIYGRLFTLPNDRALILLSFVTLFVRFTGSRLWKIVAFYLHRIRSSPAPRDGLYHHQQVILRNVESDSMALAGLLYVGWHWRRKTRHAMSRSAGLSVVAVVHLALLLTAALFVKNMITAIDATVLIEAVPENCGSIPNSGDSSTSPSFQGITAMGVLSTSITRHLQNSADYVRACYRGKHVSSKTCQFYKKPSLESIRSPATCPFDQEICQNSEWIHFASKYIDSREDLGINSRVEDKIRLKKSSACGVLDEKLFEKTDQLTKPFPHIGFKYYLGPTNDSSYTYATSDLRQNYTSQPYKLSAHVYVPNSDLSDFKPISRLNVTGADLSILFLENRAVYFIQATEDPWFHAPKKQKTDNGINYYISEKTVSILACTETYEFCNQKLCTTPAGIYEAKQQTKDFPFVQSLQQQAILDNVLNATTFGSVSTTVGYLRDKALLAQNYLWFLSDERSDPLPKKQWITEVENLHNISMANLQLNVVEQISPITLLERDTSNPEEFAVQQGHTYEERQLCHMQMVKSDAHISFRVLGLSLVLGVGTIIICLSFSIDSLVFWGSRRASPGSRRDTAKREWIVGDMLQLFRAMMESRGVGTWTGYRNSVPVLLQPEMKFTLDGPSEEQWALNLREDDYLRNRESRLLGAVRVDELK